jgi:hypothetical protein
MGGVGGAVRAPVAPLWFAAFDPIADYGSRPRITHSRLLETDSDGGARYGSRGFSDFRSNLAPFPLIASRFLPPVPRVRE